MEKTRAAHVTLHLVKIPQVFRLSYPIESASRRAAISLRT